MKRGDTVKMLRGLNEVKNEELGDLKEEVKDMVLK